VSTRLPVTAVVGLGVSTFAIGLWITEQLTGQLLFEYLTIPFKLMVVAAPLFFLSDLSGFLHGRPRIGICLGLALIATTLCAMLIYLPWRSAFAAHFNNAVYRWYYNGMLGLPAGEKDFAEWQTSWSHRIPHMIEAGLVVVYYIAIVGPCTLWRPTRFRGAIVAIIGYLLLFLVPLLTGLILWDYDTFLKGIAFDSISMDLFPAFIWNAGDYSVFLYTFMFIFFAVSAAFMYFDRKNPKRVTLLSSGSASAESAIS
jgi:hypothetical protein